MRNLDLYLAFERLMLDLDEGGDPIADRVRDLMDSVWYRLSPEEIALLDSRGQIDPAQLFPVRLPLPPPPELPVPTIVDQQFEDAGWQAPVDWRKRAA
jgi:hypothetical protein